MEVGDGPSSNSTRLWGPKRQQKIELMKIYMASYMTPSEWCFIVDWILHHAHLEKANPDEKLGDVACRQNVLRSLSMVHLHISHFSILNPYVYFSHNTTFWMIFKGP